MKPFFHWIAWMAVLLVPLPLPARDPATFPYGTLVQMFQWTSALGQYDTLRPRITVGSTRKGIRPEQIVLTILSRGHFQPAAGIVLRYSDPSGPALFIITRGGTRALNPEPDGSLHLALDKALAEENPQVRFQRRPIQAVPWIRRNNGPG